MGQGTPELRKKSQAPNAFTQGLGKKTQVPNALLQGLESLSLSRRQKEVTVQTNMDDSVDVTAYRKAKHHCNHCSGAVKGSCVREGHIACCTVCGRTFNGRFGCEFHKYIDGNNLPVKSLYGNISRDQVMAWLARKYRLDIGEVELRIFYAEHHRNNTVSDYKPPMNAIPADVIKHKLAEEQKVAALKEKATKNRFQSRRKKQGNDEVEDEDEDEDKDKEAPPAEEPRPPNAKEKKKMTYLARRTRQHGVPTPPQNKKKTATPAANTTKKKTTAV